MACAPLQESKFFDLGWAPASAGARLRVGAQVAIRQAVEAAEDLQAEPVVEEVLFADHHAVAVELLDIALHRAGEEGVGEPFPSDADRGVPGGGEDRVAAARGVGAGNAHARGLAGFADDGGLGEGFAEDRHLLAGPAVVAGVGDDGGRLWFERVCSMNHIGT